MFKKIVITVLISLFLFVAISGLQALENLQTEKDTLIQYSNQSGFRYFADQELFFMPTSYTLPQGSSFITDYELVSFKYTNSITGRTQLGFFSYFPVYKDFNKSITITIKQNYFRRKKYGIAAFAFYNLIYKTTAIGNVFSFYPLKKFNLHFSLNAIFNFKGDTPLVIMAGARYEHFILEYTYFNRNIDNSLTPDPSVFMLGLRLGGRKLSVDVAAVRPMFVKEEQSLIYLFPYLKVTYLIK